MSQSEFLELCLERTILPAIALECEEVIEALKQRDVQAVIAALDSNF